MKKVPPLKIAHLCWLGLPSNSFICKVQSLVRLHLQNFSGVKRSRTFAGTKKISDTALNALMANCTLNQYSENPFVVDNPRLQRRSCAVHGCVLCRVSTMAKKDAANHSSNKHRNKQRATDNLPGCYFKRSQIDYFSSSRRLFKKKDS